MPAIMTIRTFPAGVVWNKDTTTDALPDLFDFPDKTLFIDIGSDRIILLELGFLGLYQSVEAKQNFLFTEFIFLCSKLITGQLLVSVDLIDAVCPGRGLPVGYDDGPGLVLFNEICCADNWERKILYIPYSGRIFVKSK